MPGKTTTPWIPCALALLLALAPPARAEDEALTVTAADGFLLPAKLSRPADVADADVAKVIVILHGSGPTDMDGSFAEATADKKGVFLYRELAHALAGAGHAVLRYHKRAYVWRQRLMKDQSLMQGEEFKTAMTHPLGDMVADAIAAAKEARKRFPKARLYFLGHSQGTFVGIQAARQMGDVAGVGAIGFQATTIHCLSFEQLVYRPLGQLRAMDTNHDRKLDQTELEAAAKEPIALALRTQMPILDTDGDKAVSFTEIQAANFGSFMVMTSSDVAHTLAREELTLPPIAKVLREATFKVAFFQGEWDNQTPAYQVRGIELTNKFRWKNAGLSFHYFPELGHELGKRTSYEELVYRKVDPAALARIVEVFGGL